MNNLGLIANTAYLSLNGFLYYSYLLKINWLELVPSQEAGKR